MWRECVKIECVETVGDRERDWRECGESVWRECVERDSVERECVDRESVEIECVERVWRDSVWR